MPVTVVSVNNRPEHLEAIAQLIIDAVKDKAEVVFGGNCISSDGIKELLETVPDASLLFAASTFTAEEQDAIFAAAREAKADIKTFGVPPNLHEQGPTEVVKYLVAHVGEILA